MTKSHDADECRIVGISKNGKAIKVSYPLDSGGRATAWFEREKFTSFDLTKKYEYIALNAKISIYRYSDANGDYGYVKSNNSSDKVYILGKDSSGKYYQLIYKLDSGVWKMGWGKKSQVDNAKWDDANTDKADETSASDFWKLPFEAGSYYETQSFGNKANSRAGRPYHSGWDIVANDGEGASVYAVADGTVKYKGGGRNDGANGLHVIIKHSFNGKTVYSLYSHLDSYSACPDVGSKVSQGKKIGTMGNTGASSGAHLHLGIFADGYSNSPWGYTNVNSDTSMSYDGITYYNPKMVIDNDKLP